MIDYKRYGSILCRLACIVVCLAVFFSVLLPNFNAENMQTSETEPKAYNTLDYVRVGIKYSDTMVQSYKITTPIGVEYGIQDKDTHNFTSYDTYGSGLFTVKRDTDNLYISILSFTSDNTGDLSGNELLKYLRRTCESDDVSVFMHYEGDNSEGTIRIGAFESDEEADEYLRTLMTATDGSFGVINERSGSDTLILCDENDKIAVGYRQTGDNKTLAVKAIQPDDGSKTYIVDPGGYKYEGVFEFRLFNFAGTDGISVINTVPFELYVQCVMSYEISPSWSLEAQKTFSLTVRTYTYSSYNKHKSLYFNICNSTHCQVYYGSGRINDTVRQASKETEGQILTYNGKYVSLYYSASAGGCTVSVDETWSSSHFPYLEAVPTPWETYRSRSVTKWTVEFSPNELYIAVKAKCPELEGDIETVETTCCTNSPHIYSITFTDIYGNKSTVSAATQVRYLLGLNSSNFIVGKAGETVERPVYVLDNFDSIYSENFSLNEPFESQMIYAVIPGGDVLLDKSEDVVCVSGSGDKTFNFSSDKVSIVTPSGEKELIRDGLPDILNGNTVYKTEQVTLSGNEGNFVFDGCGWGHGTGLSQYGMIDLVELGYDYKTILEYYLSGTEIVGANTIS